MRSVIGSLALFGIMLPSAAAQVLPLDSSLARWGRTQAIPIPAVDQPYSDSAYQFLARLVGSARVIGIAENIHGAHEPLQFRNQLIKFAIRNLGVTAVAIESGFSESNLVDRFVLGGPGEIDSVLSAGITYGFGKLPENYDLVRWLREHNTTARRKVRFVGVDQTGVDGEYEGRAAVDAALTFLQTIDAESAAAHRGRLSPLLDQFAAKRVLTLSTDQRTTLQTSLVTLHRRLARARRVAAQRSDADLYRVAERNAWAALRVLDAAIVGGSEGARSLAAIRLRDSVMAENTLWTLGRVRPDERIVVFAHNGHIMNVPMTFAAMGPPTRMMGQRLRETLGRQYLVIGTATNTFDSLGTVPTDLNTLEAALVRLSTPGFAIDLRTSDRLPSVRALLAMPWLTRLHAWIQPVVPRDIADVMVVFDRVTRTTLRP